MGYKMGHNELRKDYILDRWVVIATERGRRPSDFVGGERVKNRKGACPFCPGNEHMTPPAVLIYKESGGTIEKLKDNDFRHKNWLIRCFPNLFPAFSPPDESGSIYHFSNFSEMMSAIGHHEVLVESPLHDDHPSDMEIQQLAYVIEAYMDRLRELSSKQYVKYVSIFRNHGAEAGASLSHAHSQIIATPLIPKIIKEELEASRKFWNETGKCVFCEIIRKESESPRFITENSDFLAFAPWASINPMEFWLFPKRHEASILEMTRNEIVSFASILKTCLKALKNLLNDPPYNFGFHMSTDPETGMHYHWHLEVYPKLATWAGFEKSTGFYINTVSPEIAADSLRRTI
ncbi:MAG: galactose-1-phosphate uridylyltransferase [Candidatus Bathyarchaeia archaeon]